MKKGSEQNYYKKIAAYESKIEESGLKSLEPEEIMDYRNALKKNLIDINKSIKGYQLLLAGNLSLAAVGTYKVFHTINYILNKYSNGVPSNAELINKHIIAATAAYGLGTLVSSFASGTDLYTIMLNKQSKKEVEELIGLTETYSRIK